MVGARAPKTEQISQLVSYLGVGGRGGPGTEQISRGVDGCSKEWRGSP